MCVQFCPLALCVFDFLGAMFLSTAVQKVLWMVAIREEENQTVTCSLSIVNFSIFLKQFSA